MDRSHLNDCWARYLDGTPLTAAEEIVLADYLVAAPRRQRDRLQDEQLDRDLRWLERTAVTGEAFVAATLARLDPVEPPTPASAPRTSHPRDHRGIWLGWLAAALVLILVGGALHLGKRPPAERPPELPQVAQAPPPEAPELPPTPTPPAVPPSPPAERPADPPQVAQAPPAEPPGPPPAPASRPAEAPALARLTYNDQCRWDGPAPGERLEAGTLRLLAGTATLTLDGGVRLELRGPAVLDLVTPRRAGLTRGRLKAFGPSQAVGFQVQTPLATVTDRGAEFDVAVADDGATQVHVLRGAVDLAESGAGGATWPLRAGDTKRLDAPPRRGPFYGRLTVNGKTREFTDPREYEKALRELWRGALPGR